MRPRFFVTVWLATLVFTQTSFLLCWSGDWPTFRHDQRRSGVTDEQLEASELQLAWRWQSKLPPAPAWPDSARWDAYAKLDGLRSMRDYDPVFHPVIVDQRLYFASNADDTLRCLSLTSGEVLWSFTADGPLRVAPTIYKGKAFLGCDDGSVKCLAAEDGQLVWSTTLQPEAERFVNDGRLCSSQPVRTGAVIDPENNTVVAACGIFPWDSTSLFGLDTATGTVKWNQDLGTGWTLEGALLLGTEHIVAPQGRSPPQLFSRVDGESLGTVSGGGGSFVLMTEDDQLMHGPGNKGGWITSSQAATREKVASFEGGTAVVVKGDKTFLLSPTAISAIGRKTGQVLWRSKLNCPHEIIMAGNILFAGGDDAVAAVNAESGELIWAAEVSGRAIGLAVAQGRLIVSTDRGEVSVFSCAQIDSPPNETLRGRPLALSDALADRLGFEVQAVVVEDEATGSPSREIANGQTTDGLLHRWLFHRDLTNLPTAENLAGENSVEKCELSSVVESGLPLPLPPNSRLVQFGNEHAWVLDETIDSQLAADFKTVPVPEKDFTAIATVRIDQLQSWGGLISVMQDNGSFEKGWILGFQNEKFGVAVNAANGPDQLTWVLAKKPFQTRRWAHVAATYDGKTLSLFIDGRLSNQSTEQSGAIVYPEQAGFQIGSYRDDDEHFFSRGRLNEIALFNRALTAEEIDQLYQQRVNSIGEAMTAEPPKEPPADNSLAELRETTGDLKFAAGPELQFVEPGTARLRWTMAEPTLCSIEVLSGRAEMQTKSQTQNEDQTQAAATEQEWLIQGVDRNELITFRIKDSRGRRSRVLECDGHFDYTRPQLPKIKESGIHADTVDLAESISESIDSKAPRGIAFVFGSPEQGNLAEAISLTSGFDVIVFEADDKKVSESRKRLLERGVYGRPVTILNSSVLPLTPPGIANLIVFHPENAEPVEFAELQQTLRFLKPEGRFSTPVSWLESPQAASLGLTLSLTSNGFDHWSSSRAEGSAGWTHMYGAADNSAFAGETLQDASQIDDLAIAWCGRPGPRYQSDRGNRKPSPLAAGGRLYLQGLHRMIGMDAHNGTILWSHELPEVVRFNVPRDCSNWCADDKRVYLAAGGRCKLIDGPTGEMTAEYPVWNPTKRQMDWGFVARHDNLLLGSCVQAGSSFTEFWGGEAWYDAKDGENAKKVSSDGLFALDAETGEMRWNYQGALVVNPTLSIGEEKIVFVECRSKPLIAGDSRRLDGDELWQNLFIVALDIRTGEKLWEAAAMPMPGVSAMYGVIAEGKFLLQTSNAGEFAVYAINAANGKMLWRGKYKWEADHHGKHLSRPAVLGGKIFLRPLTLELESGKVLAEQFPVGHQCGTYTASKNALFLRAGSLTMWDGKSTAATRWNRIRPDCWISTIPAEGMLLSPEGGGGCSCGGWIETSMGFAPIRRKD